MERLRKLRLRRTPSSIVSPSTYASVVGMHPTIGLISSDNIIPLSPAWDTAGPMGKTVTDIAMAMTVFAGQLDTADVRSALATPVAGVDFMSALDPNALQGVRLGLVGPDPSMSEDDVLASFNINGVLESLEAAGAEVVVVQPPGMDEPDWWQIIACGLRDGVNAYLAENQMEPATLADIIAFNNADPRHTCRWDRHGSKKRSICEMSAADRAQLATVRPSHDASVYRRSADVVRRRRARLPRRFLVVPVWPRGISGHHRSTWSDRRLARRADLYRNELSAMPDRSRMPMRSSKPGRTASSRIWSGDAQSMALRERRLRRVRTMRYASIVERVNCLPGREIHVGRTEGRSEPLPRSSKP